MNAATLASCASDRLGQRVVGRDGEEGGAEERIGARGEDLDQLVGGRRLDWLEADQHAFRASDPVALHQAHLLGPALELSKRVEQSCA